MAKKKSSTKNTPAKIKKTTVAAKKEKQEATNKRHATADSKRKETTKRKKVDKLDESKEEVTKTPITPDLRREVASRAVRTGRATRSSGNHFLFASNGTGRTPLQAERDTIANTMPKAWLPNPIPGVATGATHRPSLRSRGIRNPGNHCYMNSVLQAFMHIPIFLHWIRGHTPQGTCFAYDPKETEKYEVWEAPCVKCHMRRLVEEYWGPTNPNTPIPDTSLPLRGIKAAAFAVNQRIPNKKKDEVSKFHEHIQDDAHAFFEWLIDEISTGDAAWVREFKSLFEITSIPLDTCRICGVQRPGAEVHDNGLIIPIRTTFSTLEQAIDEELTSTAHEDKACETCGVNTTSDCRVVIKAAPRVLRIQLVIYEFPKGKAVKKIFHATRIGEELDLTEYQECAIVPLRYRLAVVIPHSGPRSDRGHYIASVRGPGPSPFYNINDPTVRACDAAEFTANPQRPRDYGKGPGFQVYILTYIRDESSLDVVGRTNKRMLKSLA